MTAMINKNRASLLQHNKGFTIIEVLIVLAIAAVIILIVFLAVPQLSRNNRNTRRRTDGSKALALLQENANNNNGAATVAPSAPNELTTTNANYSIISTVNYNVSGTAFQALVASGGTLAADTLYIRNYSVCTSNLGATGGSQRQYTATFLVESPGATASGVVPAGFTSVCLAS